jgi:hypothetical protein
MPRCSRVKNTRAAALPRRRDPPCRTHAPWDFAGTAGDAARSANPFDTSSLAAGQHTISARIDLSSGGTSAVHSTFTK